MIYNIEKSKEYLMEKYENESCNVNIHTIYEALNNGGISYTALCDIEDGTERQWSAKSGLSEFYSFWKYVLGSPKIAKNQNNNTTPNIFAGDVLVEYHTSDATLVSLIYVLEVNKDKNGVQTFSILRTQTKKNSAQVKSVKSDELANRTLLLQFSKVSYNLSNFYNLIFKSLLGNQALFVRLLLSCCPETKKIDGDARNNAYESLFSVVACSDLQAAIEQSVLHDSCMIKSDSSVAKLFVKTVFINSEKDKSPISEELTDKIIRIQNGKNVPVENFSKPIINNLLRGKTTKYIESFFKDKSNRILFQVRFSLVLQFYLLLSSKATSKQLCQINESCLESFGNTANSVIEYVTLNSLMFERITYVVNYFSNYDIDMDVYVDSLFALAGCVFDSVGITFEDNHISTYEEFGRFRELAKCYGARTLDYYFALQRYKDVNHFAASELANIYYFGWEFEGYKIEKNTEEAMKLLNSCKDFSVSARWSLGENYKRLADLYFKLKEKYASLKSVREEKQNYSTSGDYSEDFKECLRICNIDYDKVFHYTDDDIFNTIYVHLNEMLDAVNKKSRSLYLGCGDYPPALNSLANNLKISMNKLISKEASLQEICRSATEVIYYYVKAARSGWVYSFNNLYSMFSKPSIMNALNSNVEGQKAIKSAYAVLKDIEVTSSYTKGEEQFDALKQKLIAGVSKELVSYQGRKYTIYFKYTEPMESPINFLVVSAFFDNLYGMNHLGVEYIKTGIPSYYELALKLFECAAEYGAWGHYNLAKYIYSDDEEKRIYHLKMASSMGLQEATNELESVLVQKQYRQSERPR